MIFELEASSTEFDPADFVWRKYKGATKKFTDKHSRHDPVFEDGDIFGIKQTRNRKPDFHIRLLKESNILYRCFQEREIVALEKTSVPFNGVIKPAELSSGRKRHNKKIDVSTIHTPNRLKDALFVPRRIAPETIAIDKENYQWRKVKAGVPPIKVVSKKTGKSVTVLKEGDVFGLRYYKPSFGGYILFTDGVRRQISTELYVRLTESAIILPSKYQKEGIFQVKEVRALVKQEKAKEKKNVPVKINIKKPEETAPAVGPTARKYDVDNTDIEAEIFKSVKRAHNEVAKTRRHLKDEVPDLFEQDEEPEEKVDKKPKVVHDKFDDWLQGEEEIDFDEEEEFEEPEEEIEEGEEEPEEEEPKEEEEEVVDTGPATPKPKIDPEEEKQMKPLADVIQPGDIVQFSQAHDREFMFLSQNTMERNPNLIEFIFHEKKKKDEDFMYRVRLSSRYTVADFKRDGAEIVRHTEHSKELTNLINEIEFAEFKPMSFFK